MAGEFIKIKGISLLVLDEINENPFVVDVNWNFAPEFNLRFAGKTNNYDGSNIEKVTNRWFAGTNIPAIERELDLTMEDGNKVYGKKMVKAAPLTLDEYNKYSKIIIPHIKDWFWLATAHGITQHEHDCGDCACDVCQSGWTFHSPACYGLCGGLVPAFILDKNKIN